jgi:hypothetical protein
MYVTLKTTVRDRNLKRRCIGIKLHTRAADGVVLPTNYCICFCNRGCSAQLSD